MIRIRTLAIGGAVLGLAFTATALSTTPPGGPPAEPLAPAGDRPEAFRFNDVAHAGAYRILGKPVAVGNGTARTYLIVDVGHVPLEVGVVLSEDALDGLPPADPQSMHHGHTMGKPYLLELPSENPTPYEFVQLDWNAAGHEPPGVYDRPHFDFHFYRVPLSVVRAIDPAAPGFAEKAARYPDEALRMPFYLDAATAARLTPAQATVPQMGLHWIDVRSPELQGLAGRPEKAEPFTKTFIYGSWDGAFIFDEPMITRDYLLAKRAATDPVLRDEVIPVSAGANGVYGGAYRITWDAGAREYRVAITGLAPRGPQIVASSAKSRS